MASATVAGAFRFSRQVVVNGRWCHFRCVPDALASSRVELYALRSSDSAFSGVFTKFHMQDPFAMLRLVGFRFIALATGLDIPSLFRVSGLGFRA